MKQDRRTKVGRSHLVSGNTLVQLLITGLALVTAVATALLFIVPAGDPLPGGATEADPPSRASASMHSEEDPAAPDGDALLYSRILSVTDATQLADEGWLILDRRERRLHRISTRGELVHSFGQRGDGPGELRSPEAVVLLGDTLVVAESTRGTFHYFTTDGAFLARRHLVSSGCPAAIVMGLATSGPDILALYQCLNPGAIATVRVERITPAGDATVLLEEISQDPAKGMHYFHHPLLGGKEGGFYFGFMDEDCIGEYDLAGYRSGEICSPSDQDVPVPNMIRDQVSAMQARSPARLTLPPYMPSFDRVFGVEGGVVFRTITGSDTRALDFVGRDGSRRRLSAPANESTRAGRTAVLTGWEALDGTHIATYRY